MTISGKKYLRQTMPTIQISNAFASRQNCNFVRNHQNLRMFKKTVTFNFITNLYETKIGV